MSKTGDDFADKFTIANPDVELSDRAIEARAALLIDIAEKEKADTDSEGHEQ